MCSSVKTIHAPTTVRHMQLKLRDSDAARFCSTVAALDTVGRRLSKSMIRIVHDQYVLYLSVRKASRSTITQSLRPYIQDVRLITYSRARSWTSTPNACTNRLPPKLLLEGTHYHNAPTQIVSTRNNSGAKGSRCVHPASIAGIV